MKSCLFGILLLLFSLRAGAESSDRQWFFALGGGYQISTQPGQFSTVTATPFLGASSTGSGSLTFNPSYVVQADLRFVPKNHWGFMVGADYEGTRTLKSGMFNAGSTSIVLAGGAKMQISTAYVNAVYRWENFYLPFGLNYSTVNFTTGGGVLGTDSVQGGIGAQLGVGWQFNNWFSLEAYSWATSMQMNMTTSGAYLECGTGIFGNLILMGKVLF